MNKSSSTSPKKTEKTDITEDVKDTSSEIDSSDLEKNTVSTPVNTSGIEEDGIFGPETIRLAQEIASEKFPEVKITGTISGQTEKVLNYTNIRNQKNSGWFASTDGEMGDSLVSAIQEKVGMPKTGIFNFDLINMLEIIYGCKLMNDIEYPSEFVKKFQSDLNAGRFF